MAEVQRISTRAGLRAGTEPGFGEKMKRLWKEIYKNRAAYIFISPFFVVFIALTILPVFVGAFYSFTHFTGLDTPRWAGLSNYRTLMVEDTVFPIAITNTLRYAIIAGPCGYFLSFILAWFLNRSKYKLWYALAFYAPSVAGGAMATIIWDPLFNPDRYGYLNFILLRLGVIHEPIPWTMDARYIMITMIIIALWGSMGTGFLVFLAGFQSMPKEIYDAGRVDGIASDWQELWYITIPMMKPQLLFSAVMTIINSFGVAGQVASPHYSAHTIVSHLNDHAFTRFELGYASAVAVILFVATFGLNRLLFALLSSKGE